MATRIFGSGIRRREDPRLITGAATYTDDLTLPDVVYAVMIRSPHAHARITRIDTSRAKQAPGVVAVFTGAEIDGLQPMPCAWLLPNSGLKVAIYRCAATDVVRYVGDIVGVVVAETAYQAHDALELVEVDYAPLPAVVDPVSAQKAGAPQLHADIPNNEAFHWTVAGGDIDAAFKNADLVVKERIVQQRLIPNAMEPRAALAKWSGATGELTLWNTTQAPHIVRFLCSVVTGVPEDRVRVIAPEVGGGFGSKVPTYPADFITVFCARTLNRPVKWTETRRENYQATTHGRDHVQEIQLAATKDGRMLGLRATVWAGMGAYLSTAAPGIPTIMHGLMLSGVYDLPALKEDVHGVYTNTTPVEAYRGAGRPEATFLVERMIDKLASELGMDPAAVRLKNMIPRFEKRPQRHYGTRVRQRRLPRRPEEAARPRQLHGPADGAGQRQDERPLRGYRPRDLRGDLRPRAVTGRRRYRLPGRPVGERNRARASDRQGACLHRRLPARPR
jgi:carbon-monoxide dehydrogenase large subunit